MAPQYETRAVQLRDASKATIFLLSHDHVDEVPDEVIEQMRDLYNNVIEEGQTYPYYEKAETKEQFEKAWLLKNFAIIVKGDVSELTHHLEVLGTYYVKPNYAGRCSHVSNAGFLVSPKSRGNGIGKILGKSYVEWAPKLGYTYSVFNLVFATNVASWRAWESLGFTRLGTVPGAAKLKGFDQLVDAYIYGKSFV